MTKEITDLEEQLSNLSDHDLYAVIATASQVVKTHRSRTKNR